MAKTIKQFANKKQQVIFDNYIIETLDKRSEATVFFTNITY